MGQTDYDAGRAAGIHEGRRLAATSRRWIDLFIMVLIVAAVVIITQVQYRSTERLVAAADTKAAETARAAFQGCELRNKIVKRQIQFYRDNAQIEQTNRFIDEVVRQARVTLLEGVAADIEAIGVRDCRVYLKVSGDEK